MDYLTNSQQVVSTKHVPYENSSRRIVHITYMPEWVDGYMVPYIH